MDRTQGSFEMITSPASKGNKTPQELRTPKNPSNLSSPYEILRSSNSSSSLEDLSLALEKCRTPTPKNSIYAFGRTREGKLPFLWRKNRVVEKFTIDFADLSYAKDSIQQFCETTENFETIKYLEIIIRNQKEEEADVIKEQLSKIFNQNLKGLRSLKLDFFRSQIASECLDYLNKDCLICLRSLRKIELNLWGSDINNLNIQGLSENFEQFFGEIEEFSCNLGQTKVTEEAMILFFREMPRVKRFEMSFGNCVFTNDGLKSLVKNTLLFMKSLESLSLQLEGTKISSSQVEDLLKNLPESLKKLRLDLRWTKVCDSALGDFLEKKLPDLKDLAEIEFKVDCTQLSESVIKKIEKINKQYARKIDIEACLKYFRSLNLEEQ